MTYEECLKVMKKILRSCSDETFLYIAGCVGVHSTDWYGPDGEISDVMFDKVISALESTDTQYFMELYESLVAGIDD